ncbi:MAG: sensor histidine kinase, partial [Chloroflexota bacterium]
PERWIMLKAQPTQGVRAGTRMVVLVLQDVTALKLAEQERDAWMQTLAHDLKTPLTAIRGYAQLAVRNVTARDRQGALNDLERVVQASDRLTKMVEQLGDLTRIQTQGGLQLHVRPCNMVHLVQRAVELAQASTTLHRLQLELLVDNLIIPADAERLERVFENLLSNAIKYSPEGGDISVRAGQNEPGMAYASITDAGIGISQEDMARIFVRFGRGRNVGQIDGSGIGLSFCQAVVQAHGGQIHLESQPSKGTRVTVRFPLLAPASVGDAVSDGAPWERFHLPLASD